MFRTISFDMEWPLNPYAIGRVGAGRARLFRHPPGLNYRINEYYLHVSSVYFLLYY